MKTVHLTPRAVPALAALSLFSAPLAAFAQDEAPKSEGSSMLLFIVFLVAGALIGKFFAYRETHRKILEHEPPKTPIFHSQSLRIILSTLITTALLYALSLKTITAIEPFSTPEGRKFSAVVFILLAVLGIVARLHWPQKSREYAFGVIVGTVATFALISFKQSLFATGVQDSYRMALGVVVLILGWKFLFGPWRTESKVVVLGTFIFWVGVHLFFKQPDEQRLAYALTVGAALVPAALWCWLFLGYHKQRMHLALLMFFSGMVSTAPILLYDKIVKSGAEMHFFLFKIVPESFTRSSSAFVSGNMIGVSGQQNTLMATLISFLLVGLIEEVSKFWVLKRSGQDEFTSIDDVMQLGIIVAIGFAFAENVLNPSYFLAFVQQHLLGGDGDWGSFLGNVLGRAILTNMVHIVSTGILGYYYGLSLFASQYLREAHTRGRMVLIPTILQRTLRLPERVVFVREMMLTGFALSIILHGVFNFLVTLSDLLPGNPRTLGELFNAGENSPLQLIAILAVPSLFYVAGGFWLLSMLFYRKDCMKERGHLVRMDTFVPDQIRLV